MEREGTILTYQKVGEVCSIKCPYKQIPSYPQWTQRATLSDGMCVSEFDIPLVVLTGTTCMIFDAGRRLITKSSLLFSLSSTEIHRPKPYAHLKIVPYLWICLWMERKWRLCRLAWTESWCGLGTEFMFLVEWSQSGCFHHVCLFLCVVGCEWEWFKTRILRTFLLINSQRRIFIQCAAFIITSL